MKKLITLFFFVLTANGQDTISLSQTPAVMTLSPDQKLIYVMGKGGNLDIINIQERSLKTVEGIFQAYPGRTLSFGSICVNDVFGIVIPFGVIGASPLGSNRVFVVDPASFTVRQFWPGMNSNYGCAFSKDGQLLYISSALLDRVEPRVAVINRNLEVQKLIWAGLDSIPFIQRLPNSNKLYLSISNAATNKGWLGVLKDQDQEMTKVIPLPFMPDRVTFSPDGQRLYALLGRTNGIAVFDTVSDELVEINASLLPSYIAFSGDSRLSYLAYIRSIEAYDLAAKRGWGQMFNVSRGPIQAIQAIRQPASDLLAVLLPDQLVLQEVPRIPAIYAITNGASFSTDTVVSPGEWISLFGRSLSYRTVTAKDVPLPTELEGTRVWAQVGNNSPVALPLVFASINQINAQFPTEIPVGASVKLWVEGPGNQKSESVTVSVVASTPALFAWPDRSPILADADGKLISQVAPDSVVTAYATGLGQVLPGVASGRPAPLNPLSWTVNQVQVFVAGRPCPVLFAGLSPSWVGLYQLNLKIPADVPTGKQSLTISQANTSVEYVVSVGGSL